MSKNVDVDEVCEFLINAFVCYQCWLKKQEDVLFPAVAAIGENVMWTSGLIFGEGEVI